MKPYLDLLKKIMDEGVDRDDRTDTGTRSIFGHQIRFDLKEGFPLVTTREIKYQSMIEEGLWFISSSTNVNDLPERTQPWWRPWADENGDLGPIYGEQLRISVTEDVKGRRYYVDQLADVIDSIRKNPSSRRHVINLWHTPAMNLARLPCCHGSIIQFYVADGKLSCHTYQRSGDAMLGVPVNIAWYALFTHMIAQQTDLEVGDLIYSFGDVHIYHNHFEQVKLQLRREPRPLPSLKILRKPESIDDYKFEDFEIVGYDPHPAIPMKVAI